MTDDHSLKPYDVGVAVRDLTWEAVTRPPVLRQWFGPGDTAFAAVRDDLTRQWAPMAGGAQVTCADAAAPTG